MNSIYETPITMGSQKLGSYMNLQMIRSSFSMTLQQERKNRNYNSDKINHYQYHMGLGELQCLDDGFQYQVDIFKRQGLKLHKVINVELDGNNKYNVEYIKLLVFRDDTNSNKVGGFRDGLSVSLGYLPSDNELTITEVKFKPYIK